MLSGVAQPEIKINSTSSSTAEPSKDPEKTTAVPLSISTGSHTSVTVTSTVPAVTTATPTNATTTSTIIPTTPSTTTTSTTSTTTPLPPPKTTSHTTPSPITSAPKTTAVPTTAPSSHKDREFDGLSFFGMSTDVISNRLINSINKVNFPIEKFY